MKLRNLICNQEGTTLIEALVAMVILTIGILTVMVMQTKAVGASATAMNRTEANGVALALLETLKELPFDDANLKPTTATLDELLATTKSQQAKTLIEDTKVATFSDASFPSLTPLIKKPATATAGTIVDRSGITYQLAWAVIEQDSSSKTLWVFMTWNSMMGENRLQMSTVKYKNAPL